MNDQDAPIPLNEDEEVIDLDEGIDLAPGESAEGGGGQPRIQTFGKAKREDAKWAREPNVTGAGATHVKTFHAKLREDALEFMDEQINNWLDSHPELEVKLVTTTIGELKGKTTEAAMFVMVWV